MKLTSILLAIIALTGCSARHYALCMRGGLGTGCLHQKFTAKEAAKLGAIISAEPVQEEILVWTIDLRKPKHAEASTEEAAPEPETKTDGGHKI